MKSVARAILLLGASGLLPAAQAAEVFFEPDVVYVDPDEVFTVVVEVAAVDSLRGYELDVAFDAGLLDFVSADRGTLFENYAPPHGLYWSVVDEDSLVRVECLIIPEDECVAGPGGILELTFLALEGRDETALQITSATIRDCQGVPIEPVETTDCRVVVGPMAELLFHPDPKYVLGDRPFMVSLEVGAVDSLRGFQVYLSYDNSKIDFETALVGDLLDDPYWWYVTEESDSLVRIEGVILGPGLYVNGPGELAKVHFTSHVLYDSTEVVFEEWHVWDVHTDEFYPVAVDDGLIIIDEALQEIPGETAGLKVSHIRLTAVGRSPGPTPAFCCQLPFAAVIRAVVVDVRGRIIAELVPRHLGVLDYEIDWNGRDSMGRCAPQGMYLLHVTAGAERAGAKMILVR